MTAYLLAGAFVGACVVAMPFLPVVVVWRVWRGEG